MMSRQKKVRILIFIFKITVILASYLYVYKKLQQVDFQIIIDIKDADFSYFFGALILMFVNWSAEAVKWRLLLRDIQKVNFFEAVKIVLSAIVFGLFTPNRIGEIGGRAFFLQKSNKIQGAIAASVGSFAQMLTTIVFGILGFAYLTGFDKIKFSSEMPLVLPVILSVFAVVSLVLFFQMQIVVRLSERLRVSEKVIEKLNILSDYPRKDLFKVLIISVLRYFVFAFQFYLLLLFFGVDINILDAIPAISGTYLLINVLPHVIIADLGIRGSAAIFVIGQLSANVQGILSATILLWLINVILPAFAGQFFIIKHKPISQM